MSKYKQIMLCPNSTVVAEYESGHKTDTFYQSEPQLEKEFINQLVQQGYDYISIKNESQLITNLREQIEKLNRYKFTKEE
jgi:type I restriction enzyme R subunit